MYLAPYSSNIQARGETNPFLVGLTQIFYSSVRTLWSTTQCVLIHIIKIRINRFFSVYWEEKTQVDISFC